MSKNIFIPSRISSWKGHELLLNYFSLLQQKYKDTFNIHIVSLNKSKEEKKIQLLINKLNISKKIIKKYQKKEDLMLKKITHLISCAEKLWTFIII